MAGIYVISLFFMTGSIISAKSSNNSTLIGYWPLDTNANDYSGNSLNGKAIGVTFTTNNGGKVGESAIFTNKLADGTSGINLPNNPLLTFSHSSNFTISAWVKTESSNSMIIFSQQKCTYGTVQVYLNKGQANFRIEDVNNINKILTSSVSNLNNGQWHNITALRDGSNHKLYLFVDGIGSSANDPTTGTLTNQITMNTIGKRFLCGTTENFIGNIDEVKIYSNQLGSITPFSNQITSTPLSSKTKSDQFFILIIIFVLIFVFGSILGIRANNKGKRQPSNRSQFTNTTQTTSYHNVQQVNSSSMFNLSNICSKCGHQTQSSDMFCENCGNRLRLL